MCVCARAWYAVRAREYSSARSENEIWEITPNCPETLSIVPYTYGTHMSCVYFQNERISAKTDNDIDGASHQYSAQINVRLEMEFQR